MFDRQRWGVRRFLLRVRGNKAMLASSVDLLHTALIDEKISGKKKNLAVCLRTPMSEYQLLIVDWRLDPNNSATVG